MAFLLSGLMFSISACSAKEPSEAVIEDTQGGFELLEREFGECENPDAVETDYNESRLVYSRPLQNNDSARKQLDVESQYPHRFANLGQMYPDRGTWRQTKEEVLDLVDRPIWSPEDKKIVPLLHFFDMAIMINVADRTVEFPEGSSAQKMQILVRQGSSNDLKDWKRIESWPISSGRPCGKKIATYTGVYKLDPDRIHSKYYSKLFDNAEMFETLFLYHTYRSGDPTGVAIHGTYKTTHLGRRDSGGCVRVYRDKSQCLFETITGIRSIPCLSGGKLDYRGKVISLLPKNGEADPEYLSSGNLLVEDGYRVVVVIINDENDLL